MFSSPPPVLHLSLVCFLPGWARLLPGSLPSCYPHTRNSSPANHPHQAWSTFQSSPLCCLTSVVQHFSLRSPFERLFAPVWRCFVCLQHHLVSSEPTFSKILIPTSTSRVTAFGSLDSYLQWKREVWLPLSPFVKGEKCNEWFSSKYSSTM